MIQENNIADFISRNHDPADIEKYFSQCGFKNQARVLIPLDWFNFKAEW